MLDAAGAALAALTDPVHALHLLAGVCVGVVVGVLPGLGGAAGMALLLPFVYGMDQTSALALMIGLLAVLATADTFTSVLMGVPGSAGSQATVVDGFPLAQAGQARRALSAAFAASLAGGLFGALALTFFVQVARPLVLAFGAPELFMLTVFGLSMVGALSGRNRARGLAGCGLGLLIGTMGPAPATGHMRLTFGDAYLSDGLPLVVLALGLFALPEIVDLMGRGGAVARRAAPLGAGWLRGLRDVVQHRWLVLRSALIGALVGAIPGLGGAVVDWIAYGAAVQTAKDRTRFGKGDIRGVIAPESANNAKEGGALVPTLIFGIPGSGGTAVLLGGLLLIGVQPGPRMLLTDTDTVYLIIWSLAAANVVGAALCAGLTPAVAKLAELRYPLIAPFMIAVVMFGAFQATRAWGDLLAVCAIGAASLVFKRLGWPRPPILIGFVLAEGAEVYLYQSIQLYGMDWFGRPIVLILAALTAASLWLGARARIETDDAPAFGGVWPKAAVAAAVAGVGLYAIADAWRLPQISAAFPIVVGVATAALAALSVLLDRRPEAAPPEASQGAAAAQLRADGCAAGWVAAFLAAAAIVGFLAALAAVFAAYLRTAGGLPLVGAATLAVAAAAAVAGLGELLIIRFPTGLLDLGLPI